MILSIRQESLFFLINERFNYKYNRIEAFIAYPINKTKAGKKKFLPASDFFIPTQWLQVA